MFKRENIPDQDKLFYRAHETFYINGELIPGVFRERQDGEDDEHRGMSTDWERYSTPQESRNRARVPEDNAIISLIAGLLRNDLDLEVIHDPLVRKEINGNVFPANQAHTNIRGKEKKIQNNEKVRLILLESFDWEIEFEFE